MYRLLARISPFILLLLTLYSCDFAPPEIVINKPKPGVDYINVLPIDVEVDDDKSVDRVEITLDGDRLPTSGKERITDEINITDYGVGSFTFKVQAWDKAGNFDDASREVSLKVEIVSAPTISGPSSGYTDTPYSFTLSGASSSLEHDLEYFIDWGDGSSRDWDSGTSASHSWGSAGTYYVKAQARCATHPSAESGWSASHIITVSDITVTASISPTSIDFGTVTIGQSSQRTATISNASTSEANLTGNVSISGSNYSLASGSSGTFNLSPGGYKTITINFNPSLPEGTKTGTVTISHDATNISSPATISFTGYAQQQTTLIAVTEPTSSTVWTQGDQDVTISWDTGNRGSNVAIYLYKGSSQVATITSSTGNDGSYDLWDVPTNQTPGTDYRVRVIHDVTSDAGSSDYSDYFEIQQQTGPIVVTQPTGSTVWTQGDQNVTISWDTGNLGGTVDIYLYKGTSQVAIITSDTSNDGSHDTWDVPAGQTPGTDYRVRVYYDASHYDYSDYFEIQQQTGSIVVTDPTSTTVWTQGQQNVTISWDTGNLGGTVDIHLYKGTSQVATIASGTSNDGSHDTWDVPAGQTPGTDYRARVYYDASHYDYSDYFEIQQQTGPIVVTEPTSSTVWTQGDQDVTISWETGNLGGTVDIHLYKGTSQVATIATSTSNDGSYNLWDVPAGQTPGTDYRVRVVHSASSDYSDYFEIRAADDCYEENDSHTAAYDLSSNEGTWLSTLGCTPIQADDDWYQISATSGYERVQVDCRFTDSQGDIDIALCDASGNQLDASTSTTDDEYIDYTVDGGGTYYIKIYYGDAGNQYDLWWDDIRHDRVVLQLATPAEYGTMTFARSSTSCVIFDTVYPTPPHWKIVCYNHYMDFTFSGKIDFKFHAAGSTSGGVSYCYIDVYVNGTKIANDFFVDKDWTWYSISSSNFTAGSNTVRIELQQYVPGTTTGTTHMWIDEAKTSGMRD